MIQIITGKERKQMKFLENSDWIWIPSWSDADKKIPRTVLFRKNIKLTEILQKAELEISADTRYKLYINNDLVEVGPSKGDKSIWFKDCLDITRYLRKGTNILAVIVLRYPENPMDGNHGMFRTATPGLYVKGKITTVDTQEISLDADDSWKCKINKNVSFIREEERFAPLIIHENASGNPEIFGWKTSEYDDSKWESAKPYINVEIHQAVSPGNLQERTIPYMYRKDCRFTDIMAVSKSIHSQEKWQEFIEGKTALEIPSDTEEIVEISAGEEMTGYISLVLSAGKSADITLTYAEAYVQEEHVGPDHVALKKDRLDQKNGHLEGYQDNYHVAGLGIQNEPEIYEPFWFRTFRFVQLHIKTGAEPLRLQRFDYQETGYPLEVSTSVKTSDESLSDIWEISERTLRRCMHETYEDCPYYEQLQYVMDSRTQILYTYSVSADDRLARKCIDDLARAQRYDGLLNCSYPNCNPNIIPGFSIYYILMIYDHMMYFGDHKLVEKYMPTVERILQFFEEHLSPKGYVGKTGGLIMEEAFWSFIDWAAEWNPTSGMPPAGLKGPITMESLLYIYGLQHAAKLAEYLGRKDEASQFTERAVKVQNAVRTYCINTDGMVQDGPGVEEYSQHCQVFACLTDTIDTDQARVNILRTIEEKDHFAQCTVAMRFYLFRALEKTDLYAYTDQYWEAWRTMLKKHCTTCVESEAYARSECHAWGSLALYELPGTILGVRPAAPGYEKIEIRPVSGYLKKAEGTVKTPKGMIYVKWTKEGDKLDITYQTPDSVKDQIICKTEIK